MAAGAISILFTQSTGATLDRKWVLLRRSNHGVFGISNYFSAKRKVTLWLRDLETPGKHDYIKNGQGTGFDDVKKESLRPAFRLRAALHQRCGDAPTFRREKFFAKDAVFQNG